MSQTLKTTEGQEAWVVDVNMGYGHSRAAHALKHLAGAGVVSANAYPGIPKHDERYWRKSRQLYEIVSRLKPVPLIGSFAFEAMDRFQQIPDFYPARDLSRPSLQLRQIYGLIKAGFGRHFIETLARDPLPLIATFFVPAHMADYFEYPGEIYCVTTDADISRAWAPLNPKTSRINYFASNGRVVERLKLYGVPEERIFLTGFPLSPKLVDGPDASKLKDVLMDRLCNLDPNRLFLDPHKDILKTELGAQRCRQAQARHPRTLTYTVGGAGAQRHLGVEVLQSLVPLIKRGEIRVNLIGGVRPDVVEYFKNAAVDLGLKKYLGEWVNVPSFSSRAEYFSGFDEVLSTTDILWTKPSELSFYTGLGLPIIMAPPIGSQEVFNQRWLEYVGGGFPQLNPIYTAEWLTDWIESGGVARMAWNGYLQTPTHGAYRISDIVRGEKTILHAPPLIV